MLNWLFGFFTMLALVYVGLAVASWYEDQYTTCWYCRILKALAWPYEVYRAMKY
jgi:hypothetical protein